MSNAIQIDNIPAELRTLPNWVLHRNKVPMQVSGLAASSTDPATWTTFTDAMLHVDKFDGIGFVFTGTPYTGIDLDDVRNAETGEILLPWVNSLVTGVNSYTELSPSQEGIHTIVRANIPAAIKRKHIELYDTARYFTVTGRRSGSVSFNIETRDLTELYNRIASGEFDTAEEKTEHAKKTADGIDRDVIDLASTDPIPNGRRNDTLARIAGKALYEIGFASADELYRYLLEQNQRCTPSLPDGEVRTIANSIFSRNHKTREDETPLIGGALAGTAPVTRQAPVAETVNASEWPALFKSVGALESGDIKFLIRGFLTEGTTFIGALAGEGKTLIALSMVKALTTGRDFLGRKEFAVPEVTACLYLIPESGGRAFRKRCEKFGIPDNRQLFLTRTISEGSTLKLTDARLLEAVRQLKPVVFLDTVVRFNESDDENSAAQNKALADAILELRQAGAAAIVCLHHAKKEMREKGMTLESVLRGTGDLAALADGVYGILRDSELYEEGAGPNEIDLRNVKARDFAPPMPMRLALTRRATKLEGGTSVGDTTVASVGLQSVIDAEGDLKIIGFGSERMQQKERLIRAITKQPDITLSDLKEQTGIAVKKAVRILRDAGWTKPNYRGSLWTQEGALVRAETAGSAISTTEKADVEL